MKNLSVKYFITAAVVVFFLTPSCSSWVECDSMSKSQAIFMVDVSDQALYNTIQKDLSTNLSVFMKNTGLGSIDACQSFTLSMAHLSGKQSLDLASSTIALDKKGVSQQERKARTNPYPLVKLMKEQLVHLGTLTEMPEYTSSTNLANQIIKAVNQVDSKTETTLVVFSDFVENNKYLNLYRKIPKEEEVFDVLESAIESAALNRLRDRQSEGLNVRLIMVIKPEPANKINPRDIQAFWELLLTELGLEYQFIDNLTNPVTL